MFPYEQTKFSSDVSGSVMGGGLYWFNRLCVSSVTVNCQPNDLIYNPTVGLGSSVDSTRFSVRSVDLLWLEGRVDGQRTIYSTVDTCGTQALIEVSEITAVLHVTTFMVILVVYSIAWRK